MALALDLSVDVQIEAPRTRQRPLLFRDVVQIKKVDTFPRNDAFYNLIVKTICRNDESLTHCAFVNPVNLKQAPDYLTHFPDGGTCVNAVCEGLRDGKFLCVGQAYAALDKVWANAIHYSAFNKENWAHHFALELRELTERLLREHAMRLFQPGDCTACRGHFCGVGLVAELKAWVASKKKSPASKSQSVSPVAPNKEEKIQAQGGRPRRKSKSASPVHRMQPVEMHRSRTAFVPYSGLLHGVPLSSPSQQTSSSSTDSGSMLSALDVRAATALAGLSSDQETKSSVPVPSRQVVSKDKQMAQDKQKAVCGHCTSNKRKLKRATDDVADLREQVAVQDQEIARLLRDVQHYQTQVERYQASHSYDLTQVDAAPPAGVVGVAPIKKRRLDTAASVTMA